MQCCSVGMKTHRPRNVSRDRFVDVGINCVEIEAAFLTSGLTSRPQRHARWVHRKPVSNLRP